MLTLQTQFSGVLFIALLLLSGCPKGKQCKEDSDCAAAESCAQGVCVRLCSNNAMCEGEGLCIAGGCQKEISCADDSACPGTFACDTAIGSCNITCTSDESCEAGGYCNLPEKLCEEDSAQGAACAFNGQCPSGFCVDNVCCDEECAGACAACVQSVTGKPTGECLVFDAGKDPANLCVGDLVCVDGGACAIGTGGSCEAETDICQEGSCVQGACSYGCDLTLPTEVLEGDGLLKGAGKITVGGIVTEDLIINLNLNSTTDRIEFPATVTIPAGQNSATFDITVPQNNKTDDETSLKVDLSAFGSGCPEAAVSIIVLDDDVPRVAVNVLGFVEEGQSVDNVVVKLFNDPGHDVPVEVTLSYRATGVSEEVAAIVNNAGLVAMPTTVSIPVGVNTAEFTLQASETPGIIAGYAQHRIDIVATAPSTYISTGQTLLVVDDDIVFADVEAAAPGPNEDCGSWQTACNTFSTAVLKAAGKITSAEPEQVIWFKAGQYPAGNSVQLPYSFESITGTGLALQFYGSFRGTEVYVDERPPIPVTDDTIAPTTIIGVLNNGTQAVQATRAPSFLADGLHFSRGAFSSTQPVREGATLNISSCRFDPTNFGNNDVFFSGNALQGSGWASVSIRDSHFERFSVMVASLSALGDINLENITSNACRAGDYTAGDSTSASIKVTNMHVTEGHLGSFSTGGSVEITNSSSDGGSGGTITATDIVLNTVNVAGSTKGDTNSNDRAYGGAWRLLATNTVSISAANFSGNQALNRAGVLGGGGALWIDAPSTTIEDSTFSQNAAAGEGGALGVLGGLTIAGVSVFTENGTVFGSTQTQNANYSRAGGAIFLGGSGTSLIEGSFQGNTSPNQGRGAGVIAGGGAIHIRGAQDFTIQNSSFDGNATGLWGGGALYLASTGVGILKDSTFSSNVAAGTSAVGLANTQYRQAGGAIFVEAVSSTAIKPLTVSGCDFTKNSARYGGAVYVGSGVQNVAFSNCTFGGSVSGSGNSATGVGGAMVWDGSRNGQLDGCNFEANSAVEGGGALYFSQYAHSAPTYPTIANTTMISNQSANGAGAIASMCSTLAIKYSTMQGHSSAAGVGTFVAYASDCASTPGLDIDALRVTQNDSYGIVLPNLDSMATSSIVNSIFHNNGNTDVSLKAARYGSVTRLLLGNNTIVRKNAGPGSAVSLAVTNTNTGTDNSYMVEVVNTIVEGGSVPRIDGSTVNGQTRGIQVSTSYFTGAFTDDCPNCGNVGGNIGNDGMGARLDLLPGSATQYYPMADSPCIDAGGGYTGGTLPDYDAAGTGSPRSVDCNQGDGPDIGAYERDDCP